MPERSPSDGTRPDDAGADGAVPDSAVRASLEVRAVVGRLRRRLREVPGEAQLSPAQAAVLTRLGTDGIATAASLAVAEGVRPQSIAEVLAGLERLGLIARAPDPTDGRRSLVTLTGAGRAASEANRAARRQWLTRALADRLTETERQQVLEAMALLDRVARP